VPQDKQRPYLLNLMVRGIYSEDSIPSGEIYSAVESIPAEESISTQPPFLPPGTEWKQGFLKINI